jgi:integrase
MFLSKSNGVYYLFFRDEQGVRHKVSTRCHIKSAALRFLQSYRSSSPHSSTKSPQLTEFFQQLEAYLVSTHQPGTVGIYRKSWRFLVAFVGDLRLSALSPVHFDRYKAHRLAEVSPVTVNVELRALKASLTHAVRWTVLASNPFSRLSLASVPTTSPVYFTREQVQVLLATVREKWLRDVILLAGATGMRRGEILNLRWSQVDLRMGFIQIEGHENYRTKGGQMRVIPMCGVVKTLLMELGAQASNEYVFSRNGEMLRGHYVSRKFKKYLRSLGMNHHLHLHSLRHGFASWLALDGVSIYHISKLLGHSSVGVTEKFYAHLQPEQLRESVERIGLVPSRN